MPAYDRSLCGILGRNLSNHMRLSLLGPDLTWTLV